MTAATSFSCSAASAPSFFRGHRLSRTSHSLPHVQIARQPPPAPVFAASYASAAVRQKAGGYRGSGEGVEVAVELGAGTLYDVLGLPAGATAQEIKAAFRRLARECHPDVAAAGRKGASAEEFMRIRAAYATLSDPGKRAEYDRRLIVASANGRRFPFRCASGSSAPASDYCRPSPPSFNGSSSYSSCGFARRTWETDQCW